MSKKIITNLSDFNNINNQNRLYKIRKNNDIRICIMSDIQIDDFFEKNKFNDVIFKIENDIWDIKSPSKFHTSLSKTTRIEMLSNYTILELSKMKLYKLDGYDIGYALKEKDGKYCEIVSVFNNETRIKNIGTYLLKSAIKNGGIYLDHFDGFLSNFYNNLGFIEYMREPFNPLYDLDGTFQKKYGKQDIIYRKYK